MQSLITEFDDELKGNSFTYDRRNAAGREEMHPSYMSVSKSSFAIISHAFHIPPSYLYLRANANATGAHTKYCQRDDVGRIINIGECQNSMHPKLIDDSHCNPCPTCSSK